MRVVVSTNGIVDLSRPIQGVKDLKKASFNKLILDMQDYHKEELADRPQTIPQTKALPSVEKFLAAVKEQQIEIAVVKAPTQDSQSKRRDLEDCLENLAVEAIQIAEQAGAKQVIVAPLWAGLSADTVWEKNRDFYLKLAAVCQKKDTQILLINQYKNCGGRLVRGLCSQGQVVNQWIRELNDIVGMERFGFCLDMGVCTLCGQDVQAFIQEINTGLKAVILRDCDRYRDTALLPFTGVSKGKSDTDWMGLIRILRENVYNGTLLLEMTDSAKAMSPLLKPAFLQLAYEVAEFLEWQIQIEQMLKQYSSFVLFGAGNMCRNFMKCYGDKYPPLFTCDNNPKTWGTEFCGLEVKSPEALRELPKDCGVIICNVYYREVEAQLRELEITNIGYFNDEYMSSFYADRV